MARRKKTEGEVPGLGARLLKWVGATAAVISLILGARQLTTWLGDTMERRREAATQIDLARQQASRGAFAEAWQSLDRAEKFDAGDGLDEARVEIAFAWLQEGRPGPGKPFSAITDAVMPALDRALLDAAGARRADLLAHLGWATFLRSRDGGGGDPSQRYREALDADPSNAFANAMMGHWLMWTGGAIEPARERFDIALAHAGEHRAFVRRLQLASLTNRGQPADAELLRVANEMRQRGEPLDATTADRVFAVFRFRYGRGTPEAADAAPVAGADVEATYDWVVRASPSAARAGDKDLIRDRLRAGPGTP